MQVKPARRIGQRWEATRAPGRQPKYGAVLVRAALFSNTILWFISDKSRGLGGRAPNQIEEFLQIIFSFSVFPLIGNFPSCS